MKPVRVQTSGELARALGLSPAEGAELEFRAELNHKIIGVVKRKKVTHAQLARLAGSSRTRMTALLNRKTEHIATDLMLRVLAALGYRAKVTISHVA
jgi:predicted XRE-type DNA-binding protein